MEQRITLERRGAVADVRLNRPEKMNALDDAMFDALIATGEDLKSSKDVRAVVLSGAGRAFCAGLDMGNFQKMATGERGGARLLTDSRTPGGANRAQQAALVWREVPAPVIAAVHGVAFGGGLQIALGPDIRIVAPDAKLSVLEVKWGLVPDMAGLVLMKGLLRDDVARELTYTGRVVTGEEAAAIGLATRVAADPREAALALADEIAQRSPDAVRAAKRLFAVQAHATQHDMLLAESKEQAALIGAPNQIESVMAGLQKRAPVFRD